jgi:ribosomal protein S18 acetylase RimI-like enzyme
MTDDAPAPGTADVHAAPLRVRAAVAADVDLLARWAEAMAWETEHKQLNPDTVRRGVALGLADAARARYFIAERGGVAVGTLMLTTEWSDWRAGWWWWIQSVYVPPQGRRGGVLRALYAHVHAMAAATREVCGLRLYVERDNAVAQRTYEALGMEDAGYRMFEAGLPWLKQVIAKG